jgi:CDP-diacylglycerol---glycerol-3-phosphate 3-phosphatidyltransferase
VTQARGAGASAAQEQLVNLPNAISAARIVVSPLLALLPLMPSPLWRTVAFALYVVSAVSDYFDGWFARTRGLVTDLGKTLDPLADKLLLVATFVPLIILQGPAADPLAAFLAGALRISAASAFAFPFITWFGTFSLPWWIVLVVLGRELFMTIFRQLAQKKGVVIAANYPAKVKTVMQYIWVGAAYFWFGMRTLAASRHVDGDPLWNFFTPLVGSIGVVTMLLAVGLAIASFAIYVRRYGALFTR